MNVEKRTERLDVVREKGFVPGVLYGKGFESVSIQVEQKDFAKTLQEFSTSKTFSIKFDGKTHIVYIKELQKTFMNHSSYSHFDLMKVSATDTLHSKVPVHLLGKEKFEKSTLRVGLTLEEVDIEYVVGAGISHIDLDISELTLETPFYVKDLVTPEKVTVLNDPEEMVVHLVEYKEKPEVEESDEQHAIEVPEDEQEE